MAHHMTWEPASGVRQVNIRYKTNNTAIADIERLRELTPYKNLNKIMLEALLIGSRVLIKEFEVNDSGRVNLSSTGHPVAIGGPSVVDKSLAPAREQSDVGSSYHLDLLGVEGLRRLLAASEHRIESGPHATHALDHQSKKVDLKEEGSVKLHEDAASESLTLLESALEPTQPSEVRGGVSLDPLIPDVPQTSIKGDEVQPVMVKPVQFSPTAKRHLSSW